MTDHPLIVSEPVRPVRHRALCDECGGDLRSTGEGFQRGDESFFLHRCLGCGKEETLKKNYPRIVWEEVHGD